MSLSIAEISTKLTSRQIRPSYQRIKVYEYLLANPSHPTADKIFSSLQTVIPTLSKSTIYNTLNTLSDAGLVNILNIEDTETRYDIHTETHGHFKCFSCGEIYNFPIDIDNLPINELAGFQIRDKQINFKGICIGCSGINYTHELKHLPN